MKTKNKLVNVDALICDLDNIEDKLINTLQYVGRLKSFFEKEMLKPKRKKVKWMVLELLYL